MFDLLKEYTVSDYLLFQEDSLKGSEYGGEVVFDNAYKMLTKRGVSEDEAKNKLDLMLVNVWKPYNQTVKDNPFAILDWTSVNPKEDVHVYLRGRKIVKGGVSKFL